MIPEQAVKAGADAIERDRYHKLEAALHEARIYGIGATSDYNQKIILEAAIQFAALPPPVKREEVARVEPTPGRLVVIVSDSLHPDTKNLVRDFAEQMAAKLRTAELKYGYRNGWLTQEWEAECRQHMLDHIVKGDPRDVAIYCAFMWSRGWRTALPHTGQPREGDGWWPLDAKGINSLPERLRQYITALETNCDPAGTIRENFHLREENAGLRRLACPRYEKCEEGVCQCHCLDAPASPAFAEPSKGTAT